MSPEPSGWSPGARFLQPRRRQVLRLAWFGREAFLGVQLPRAPPRPRALRVPGTKARRVRFRPAPSGHPDGFEQGPSAGKDRRVFLRHTGKGRARLCRVAGPGARTEPPAPAGVAGGELAGDTGRRPRPVGKRTGEASKTFPCGTNVQKLWKHSLSVR